MQSEKSLAELNNNENDLNTDILVGKPDEVVSGTIMKETACNPFYNVSNMEVYRDFIQHPVLLTNYVWTPTTATPTVITSDLFKSLLAHAPAQLRNKYANVWRVSTKLRITVVVQGAAQMAGQLVLSAWPSALAPNTNIASTQRVLGINKVNSRIVPHLLIDPSQNKSYVLDLPNVSTTGFYEPRATSKYVEGSWLLRITPYTKLFSGTDTSVDISVNVYASFLEPSFEGLTMTPLSESIKYKPLSSLVEIESKPWALLANFPRTDVALAITALGFDSISTKLDNGLYLIDSDTAHHSLY